MYAPRQPVAVVVGATSKWQADGRNTLLAHGTVLDDLDTMYRHGISASLQWA